MTTEPGTRFCPWCEKGFTPRSDGGKPQLFCRPACRRHFDAAGRRWVAEAIATGVLPLDALRSGAAATRALCRSGDRLPRLPDNRGPPDNVLHAPPVTRFLVEVPEHTIWALVRFGWLRGDQQDDLAAVIGALRLLGQTPAVTRVT
jgi:hypothetical protein